MKKILLKSILVLASFALYLVPAFGQTPESLSYQAVVCNSSDALLARIEVLENSESIILSDGFIDERDSTHYSVVKIGNQIWMAENLKYLPSVVGPRTDSKTEPCYYVYNYNGKSVDEAKATENYQTYGVLYNWPAAMAGEASSDANPSGVQGVCPDGWHLPSDAEWKELEMSLGMSQTLADRIAYRGTNEGSKLAGNADLWNDRNLEANSEFGSSGFSALPGGYLNSFDIFRDVGSYAGWWSATEEDNSYAWRRMLYYEKSTIYRKYISKSWGLSVRCVKD